MPSGIEQRLTTAQFQAVLTHELCHVRRRDNLTGLVQVAADTVFWFFPLTWWIRARLIEERERACDEVVLQSSDAEVYAESILAVCRFSLRAPVFAAGVAGARLPKRIASIVDPRRAQPLDGRRKALLAATFTLAFAIPLGMGAFDAPAHAQSAAASSLQFDVASLKPNLSGRAGTDGVRCGAWRTDRSQCQPQNSYRGGLRVLHAARLWRARLDDFRPVRRGRKGRVHVIEARCVADAAIALAERFRLAAHRETRDLPVYSLDTAKSGPKVKKLSDGDCSTDPNPGADPHTFSAPCGGVSRAWGPRGGYMVGRKISAAGIADALSEFAGRPVIDKTALTGAFQFQLVWTPEGYQFTANTNEGRPAVSTEPAPSFLEAVQEQLGLKLVGARAG